MKRIVLAVLFAAVSLMSYGQEIPKMTQLTLKNQTGTLKPLAKKGKWGYADAKGHFIIKPVFDQAEQFLDVHISGTDTIRVAKVKCGDKWGFLSRQGTFLVIPAYNVLSEFKEDISVFQDGETCGFLDCYGDVLGKDYQALDNFNGKNWAWFQKDGLWGVVAKDGSIIFQNQYSQRADKSILGDLYLSRVGDKYGLLSFDRKKTVKEAVYDAIYTDPADNKILIFKQFGKLGCWDADGNLISKPQYDYIAGYKGGNNRVIIGKDGKFGLMDKTGKEIIPAVLATNQFQTPSIIYKYFVKNENGVDEPRAFFNEVSGNLVETDRRIYSELSGSRYTLLEDNQLNFPFWLKRHCFSRNYMKYVSRLETTEPELLKQLPVEEENSFSVYCGRDYRISRSNNLEGLDGGLLSNHACFVKDSVSVPVGRVLVSLVKNIDWGKISRFDHENGTTHNSSSSTISLKGAVTDAGRSLVAVNVFVNNIHVQTAFATLSENGDVLRIMKVDGQLYNWKDYVDPASVRMDYMGDMLLVSCCHFMETGGDASGTYKNYSHAFMLGEGTVAGVYDGFTANSHSFCSNGAYYLFGQKDGDNVYMTYGIETPDPEKLPYNPPAEIIRFADSIGRTLVFDAQGTALRAIGCIGSGKANTPALKYVRTDWDGRTIIGISLNSWKDERQAVWEYVPRVNQKMQVFKTNLSGTKVYVWPANKDGISVYGVIPARGSESDMRYGYIGFETDYFVQPFFDNAKDITPDGKAHVLYEGGEWMDVDMSELASMGYIQKEC